jgi:predicted Zn finger-like uncharacterized protein
MKIICQTCQSKYTVSDEKVQGKTVKIKCRKCGATILVNSSGAAAAVSTNGANVVEPVSFATGTGEAPVATYTVNVADGDQRTMTLAEVIDAYNTSVITAETYVWADGMTDWLPLGQVEPIVAALHAGASQPPAAVEPTPTASPSPSYGSHVSEPAPAAYPAPAAAAAAPRVAARRDVGRGARDLFGGGGFGQETQAVADDVATSAPLFSAGVAGPAPGSQPPGGGTGQRDENSVLFSLSALTAKAGSAAPVTTQTTAQKDDSGLIDLRALSAGAPSPTAASLVPDNAALFPLGMPAMQHPVGASSPSLGLPLDMPQKNRTPIFIGLGSVVALAAVVGAFLVMKGGEDKPPVPTETAPVAVTTPPPVEPPPPATAAEPTATATATATAVAKTGGRPVRGRGAPKGGAADAPAGASTGAAAAPAKPKSGGCNCPPGDLMCAMKCSTK